MNSEFVINGALAIIGTALTALGIAGLIIWKTPKIRLWSSVAAVTGFLMLVIVLWTTPIRTTVGAGPAPTTGPLGAPIVDNRALITGQVTAVDRVSPPFPWDVKILVQKIENSGGLPNAISGKEGQVVDFRTDKDVSSLKVGQPITAIVKLSGDERGTFFYISEIVQ